MLDYMLDNIFGKRTYVTGDIPLDYEFINKNSKQTVVFFHGYGQHFGFMKKKFSFLFKDQNLLFINGIYPLAPEIKDNIPEIKLRFAWYFFNPHTKKYFIPPEVPAKIIKNLLFKLSLEEDKLLFLGFSQGGYLAPFIAEHFEQSHVISINANLRIDLLPKKVLFNYHSINGENDQIVDPVGAKASTELFIKQGNNAKNTIVKKSGHLIDQNILDTVQQVIEKSFD
jgi:predicted esterase